MYPAIASTTALAALGFMLHLTISLSRGWVAGLFANSPCYPAPISRFPELVEYCDPFAQTIIGFLRAGLRIGQRTIPVGAVCEHLPKGLPSAVRLSRLLG